MGGRLYTRPTLCSSLLFRRRNFLAVRVLPLIVVVCRPGRSCETADSRQPRHQWQETFENTGLLSLPGRIERHAMDRQPGW